MEVYTNISICLLKNNNQMTADIKNAVLFKVKALQDISNVWVQL